MEDALQAEVVGIAKDVLVELHHRLLVATKEVDLDAEDARLLHPCHLLTTCTGAVHLTDGRLGGIVPGAVGVVPEEDADTLLTAVLGQLLHLLVADLHIPEGIDEHGAPAHGCGKVDIALLLVEVTAGVHLDDPRPGTLAIGVVLRDLVLRFHEVPGGGGLDNLLQTAEGDDAPGGL